MKLIPGKLYRLKEEIRFGICKPKWMHEKQPSTPGEFGHKTIVLKENQIILFIKSNEWWAERRDDADWPVHFFLSPCGKIVSSTSDGPDRTPEYCLEEITSCI